jgi:methyl-accepting chemotaxis protein
MLKRHIGVKILVAVVISIITGMLVLSFYFTWQQRKNIMSENEHAFRQLVITVSEGYQVIMLDGDAEIAQNFIDSLKKVPAIADFRLLRVNGLESFHDNKTIHNVNKRIGEEEFIPRETEDEILVLSPEELMFQKALQSKELVSFYEESGSGEPLMTIFNPVLNRKECFSCHGSKHEVRGVIKLSTSVAQVEKNIQKSLVGSIAVMTVLTVLILVLIGYMIRKISMPIQNVADELQNISEGDGNLNVSLKVTGQDELALLSKGFNTFVSKTRGIVKNFTTVTGDLSGMAEQLATTTVKTNRNIDQQRSSIQEIAATIEEMATAIEEVSSHAQNGAEIASRVDNESRSGKAEMNQTIALMKQLSERVDGGSEIIQALNKEMENIVSILNVIEDITEQTNILALNAAIEASRAGEQGRGFSVVASEVRKLADRTNDSTREISSITKKLQAQTNNALNVMKEGRESAETSMEQAKQTSELLDEIAADASKISELSEYIAGAVAEERQAAELVSSRVQNLSSFADGNSEDSDQIASRTEDLARLSDKLRSLVNQFKV